MTIKHVRNYLKLGILMAMCAIAGYVWLSPYFHLGGKHDNNYDGDDLVTNFKEKQTELYDLKDYFLSLLPEKMGVTIGFDGRSDRFLVIIRQPQDNGTTKYESGENLTSDDDELNKLLSILEWSNIEFNTIIQKLKAANCIGIF